MLKILVKIVCSRSCLISRENQPGAGFYLSELHCGSGTFYTKLFSNLKEVGAHPGFPIGRGINPHGGANIYHFAKFSKQLHGI